MRKHLLITLVLAFAFLLCACGSVEDTPQTTAATTEAAYAGLQIGFAKINITPEEPVPLAGSADTQLSDGMLDYLFATCMAIREKGETYLIFSMDLQNPYGLTDKWLDAIVSATGISGDRIMMCYTHTHCAPHTNLDKPAINRYTAAVQEKLVTVSSEAIADLRPAQAFTATAKAENLNFVRRYIMNDGSFCGENFGSTASGFNRHETEADNTLQLIKFVREGGKDVVMANFQVHSTYNLPGTAISSDVSGAFRDSLEKLSGDLVIYINGAAGNISPKSRITKENVVKTHREWGEKLAKYAMDAQSSYTPVEAGGIQMLHTTLELSNNHADDHLLEEATQIREYFTDTGDRSGAEQMCRDAGISSIYHANAIVSNANRSATSTMELDVLTLGQLAFVFAPVEMFDTNGMYIKENSPYAMTFICGYANSVKGYLPSALAWENSGYEVVVSLYAPGTAETIADTFVDMLNRLHGIE